ncbi:MAG: NAD(+)/NADH kinase [Bacteroidota bacterium]
MRIGVFGNNSKDSVAQAVNTLLSIGKNYPLQFFLHNDLKESLKDNYPETSAQQQYCSSDALVETSDIIITFGGDGTILSAARLVGSSHVPILGVNLGKLGFMAEVSLDELELFVNDIVQGKFVTEERMLLKTTVEKNETEFYALNDIVIDNGSSSRLINVSVYVDNDYLVSFSGDGIILATPTGSTAYSLAAGGPIVGPATGVIVIQPISPHSLSARTVIVPDSSNIRIVVEHHSNEARVTADGQLVKTFAPPMNINISKADHTIRLIKRKDRSYYDVLRAKLFWGSDIRSVKGK